MKSAFQPVLLSLYPILETRSGSMPKSLPWFSAQSPSSPRKGCSSNGGPQIFRVLPPAPVTRSP